MHPLAGRKQEQRDPAFTISGRKWIDTENSLESLALSDKKTKRYQPQTPGKILCFCSTGYSCLESPVHLTGHQGAPLQMVEAREKIFSLVTKAKFSAHTTRQKGRHQTETGKNRINNTREYSYQITNSHSAQGTFSTNVFFC